VSTVTEQLHEARAQAQLCDSMADKMTLAQKAGQNTVSVSVNDLTVVLTLALETIAGRMVGLISRVQGVGRADLEQVAEMVQDITEQ
jgi:hypothetical protein